MLILSWFVQPEKFFKAIMVAACKNNKKLLGFLSDNQNARSLNGARSVIFIAYYVAVQSQEGSLLSSHHVGVMQ